jgi:hypothetical protein
LALSFAVSANLSLTKGKHVFNVFSKRNQVVHPTRVPETGFSIFGVELIMIAPAKMLIA